MTERNPDNFVVEKYERKMVSQQSQPVGYDGNKLCKESLKNNPNIKMPKVARKNVQFFLPSTNPQHISNGKFNDHIRDTYPQMVHFNLYTL